jgi:hypothetical protein
MTVVSHLVTGNTTICATIHSPTSYCFSLFDTMMMLVRGRVVYFGHQGPPAIDYARANCAGIKPYEQGAQLQGISAQRSLAGSSNCCSLPTTAACLPSICQHQKRAPTPRERLSMHTPVMCFSACQSCEGHVTPNMPTEPFARKNTSLQASTFAGCIVGLMPPCPVLLQATTTPSGWWT